MKRKQLAVVGILSVCLLACGCGNNTTVTGQDVEDTVIVQESETQETETQETGEAEPQETEDIATGSLAPTEIQENEMSELEQQIKEFENNTPSEITVTQDVLRGQWRIGDMMTLEGDAYYSDDFNLGKLKIYYDTSSDRSKVIFTNNRFVASYADANVCIDGNKDKNMQCDLVVSGLYRVIGQEEMDEENDSFSSEIELLITDVSSNGDEVNTEVCDELASVAGTIIQKQIEFSEIYADLSYLTEEQLAEYDMEIHEAITTEVTATFGYRQDGSYGIIYLDTPIISQDNPITFAWIGRIGENNSQLFAGTVRMKMKNSIDADYGNVEPGVFLYDVMPHTEDTTE